ncbi:hypothetical protein BDQ17DRAFT_1329722 [Cyathus striatus]|nr:hypothetical protein BDQ17DRAFT_1329722 [Cyathus striatus]
MDTYAVGDVAVQETPLLPAENLKSGRLLQTAAETRSFPSPQIQLSLLLLLGKIDERKAVCVVSGGLEWLEAGMLPSSQSLLRNMLRVVEPMFITYNLQATFYEVIELWMLEDGRIGTHRTTREAQVTECKERQGSPNQSERGKTSRSSRIVNWYNIRYPV